MPQGQFDIASAKSSSHFGLWIEVLFDFGETDLVVISLGFNKLHHTHTHNVAHMELVQTSSELIDPG